MNNIIDIEKANDLFRRHLLAAMDEAAMTIFGELVTVPKGKAGADDGDLPELFKCFDGHLKRLADRYGASLADTNEINRARFSSGMAGIQVRELAEDSPNGE